MNNEEREAQRELFEKAYKHLDLSKTFDPWAEAYIYKYSHVQALWGGWLKALESQPKREIRLSEPAHVLWIDSPKAYIFVDDLVRQLADQNIDLIVERDIPWVPI